MAQPEPRERKQHRGPQRPRGIGVGYGNEADLRNGILSYLGSRGFTMHWVNPVSNYVKCDASSLALGRMSDLTDLKPGGQNFASKNVPCSWVTFSFLSHTVRVSKYKFACVPRQPMPRSWHLHGSKDGQTWIILKIHSKDSSFDDKLEAAWDVSPPLSADQPYRHFRIVLMDNGSSEGNNVLALASFDLYGELCYQHEPSVFPFVAADAVVLALAGVERVEINPQASRVLAFPAVLYCPHGQRQ
ncbi:BTB/POZ domain-containing protein [Diplonema papillatum]|nr:BTB/POZ domain-containing protein [Diplonema papillatum]